MDLIVYPMVQTRCGVYDDTPTSNILQSMDVEQTVKYKLYCISQIKNIDYDTYDSAVVIAESEEDARLIHPFDDTISWNKTENMWYSTYNGEISVLDAGYSYGTSCWTAPYYVDVKYLGEATEGSVRSIVCSSFNAG